MPKKRILTNFRLDKISAVDNPCQEGARVAIIKRKEDSMDTISKKEHEDAIAKLKGEHKTALDALTADVAKIRADLEAANALAKMSDDDKEYLASETDETKRKAFISATPEVRKDTIAKRKAADETVEVAGVTVRKSAVGQATFDILKAQQKQIEEGAEAIRKANEAAQNASIAKRVQDEFSHLAGKSEDTIKVLKHLSSAPKDVQDAVTVIFTAAEALAKRGFERLGVNDGEIKKGQKPFLEKVEQIMTRDRITKSLAMQKAAEEHKDLYEAYQNAGTQLAARAN